jgi:hypothetical protein
MSLWMVQHRKWRWSAVPGLLLGLAALVRPNLLPLAVAFMVWLWYEARAETRLRRASVQLLFAIGVVAALLPVTCRNYAVANEWVLISAHGGHNFFLGNRPSATGLYEPLRAGGGQTPYDEERDARDIAEYATGRPLRASEVSAYWYARGWREVRKDPGNFVRLMLRKLALFWNDYEIPDFQDYYFLRRECPVLWLAPFTLGLAAPLAGWGIVVSRRQWRECLLLYLVIAGLVITVIPFFVFARYRLPVVPAVLVFAAVGAMSIAGAIAARDWVHSGVAVGVSLVLAMVVNWRIYRPIDFLATSYFNVGNLYNAAGRTDHAIAAWEEAVRLNPAYRKPRRVLGEAYFAAGRFDESAELLSRVAVFTIPGFSADAELTYMLATSYTNSGETQKAMGLLTTAIEVWPNDHRFSAALSELNRKFDGAVPK